MILEVCWHAVCGVDCDDIVELDVQVRPGHDSEKYQRVLRAVERNKETPCIRWACTSSCLGLPGFGFVCETHVVKRLHVSF